MKNSCGADLRSAADVLVGLLHCVENRAGRTWTSGAAQEGAAPRFCPHLGKLSGIELSTRSRLAIGLFAGAFFNRAIVTGR